MRDRLIESAEVKYGTQSALCVRVPVGSALFAPNFNSRVMVGTLHNYSRCPVSACRRRAMAANSAIATEDVVDGTAVASLTFRVPVVS